MATRRLLRAHKAAASALQECSDAASVSQDPSQPAYDAAAQHLATIAAAQNANAFDPDDDEIDVTDDATQEADGGGTEPRDKFDTGESFKREAVRVRESVTTGKRRNVVKLRCFTGR